MIEPDPVEGRGLLAAPGWLRDIGVMAWLLVGVAAILVGIVWILGITAVIVDPVLLGGVLATVASPLVSRLKRHRVPRALGAVVVLLILIAVAVVVTAIVIGGLVTHSGDIREGLNHAADRINGWAHDAGAGQTDDAKQSIVGAVPKIGKTLLQGVAVGISGLTSLAFFLSFTLLSAFFLLKDGPSLRRWLDRHLGLPLDVAHTISTNVLQALRGYFLGVTLVAAFNGIVVGIGAFALGVPLAGSIGVVAFVTAYVPYIGAIVAGFFAVLLALGSNGVTTALIMLVIVIAANGFLQNVFQPFAFGAALNLHPLAVLIVTIAAGCLLGMVGLVLAAPLTSAAVHISQQLRRARAPAEEEPPLSASSAAPV